MAVVGRDSRNALVAPEKGLGRIVHNARIRANGTEAASASTASLLPRQLATALLLTAVLVSGALFLTNSQTFQVLEHPVDSNMLEHPSTIAGSRHLLVFCQEGGCVKCTADGDCHNPEFLCKWTHHDKASRVCVHKPLFPAFSDMDTVGTVLVFAAAVLSGAAGVGGGGLFVPVFVLAVRFSPHAAVPLSKACILGGAIANLIINLPRRHHGRPLIDYDTSLYMEPATLIGVTIGVLLNIALPVWAIVAMLAVVMALISCRTFCSSIRLWKSEAATRRQGRGSKSSTPPGSVGEVAPLFPESHTDAARKRNSYHNPYCGTGSESESDDEPYSVNAQINKAYSKRTPHYTEEGGCIPQGEGRDKRLKKILVEEQMLIPVHKISVVAAAWLLTTGCVVVAGGRGTPGPAAVEMCSTLWWFIWLIPFPIVVVVLSLVGVWLVRRHKRRLAVNYQYEPGQVEWTTARTAMIPPLSFVAGVAAGMLGIGGGTIKGPLLMELKLHPEVVSATSAFMILFTSSSSVVQYVVRGKLPIDYAGWFTAIGFVGSFVGHVFVMFLVRRWRRLSIIFFTISIVGLLSACLMTAVGLYDIYKDVERGNFRGGFLDPCS